MKTLKISLELASEEWLIGTPYPVAVKLENSGPAPVKVPSVKSPRPFEFIIRSQEDQRVIQSLSAMRAIKNYRPDAPKLAVQSQELEAGAQVDYEDELAKYVTSPFPIGNYTISVQYIHEGETLESRRYALEVVPPKISQLALTVGPSEDRLAMAFAHNAQGPSTKLFQYESRPRYPARGISYERIQVDGKNSLSGVAVATELYENDGVRWFGWLQSEGIGAGIAQEATLFREVPPASIGLTSLELQGAGWQFDNETATFAALGTDDQGVPTLALIAFDEDHEEAMVSKITLSIQNIPLAWAVRLRLLDQRQSYEVLLVEKTEAGFKLLKQTYQPAEKLTGTPQVLLELKEPFVALACSPIDLDSQRSVDVLTGPLGDPYEMKLLRVPLDGSTTSAEWSFSPYENEDSKVLPVSWAIGSRPVADPVVMAKLEDRLLACHVATGGDWSVLATNISNALHIKVETIAHETWVFWINPDAGLQGRSIP